jgi:hypothetical protein
MTKLTGSTFNLSKPSKRMLAQITDAHARGELRRLLIAAEVAAAVRPKIRDRDDNGARSTGNRANTDTPQ